MRGGCLVSLLPAVCGPRSIESTYRTVYETYRKITEIYGAGNISLVGFSSGAALAIGVCLHKNAQPRPLPLPRRIIACSPGCVPFTDEERAGMEELSAKDILVGAAFMSVIGRIMSHGKDVPKYMLSGLYGDFRNLPEIHFYYGGDEVLSAEADNFATACEKYEVPYHMHVGQGLCHCYPMMPFFPEGKAALNEIIRILKENTSQDHKPDFIVNT